MIQGDERPSKLHAHLVARVEPDLHRLRAGVGFFFGESVGVVTHVQLISLGRPRNFTQSRPGKFFSNSACNTASGMTGGN